MDTDSLYLYSELDGLLATKKTSDDNTFLFNEDSVPDLSELDPTLELSVDLQQLIESTTRGSIGVSDQLFPELLAVASANDHTSERTSLDTPEIPTLSETTALCSTQLDDKPSNLGLSTIDHTYMSPTITEGTSIVLTGWNADGTALVLPIDIKAEIKQEVVTESSCQEQSEIEEIQVDLPTTNRSKTPVAGTRNPLKATPPSRERRKRQPDKGTEEYKAKRDRNNVAVRKSRDKAKRQQNETQDKVKDLTTENENLQKKVDLLSKELTVLKNLFINVGAALPAELQKYLSNNK